MINIQFRIIAVVLLTLLFDACSIQKPAEFILLQSSKESGELKFNKRYYSAIYIVRNYSERNKTQLQIDNFAMGLGSKNINKYESYLLMFYRESAITNLKNLKVNPRDLDRYSDIKDFKLEYRWTGGSFSGRRKLKNGILSEPGNTVELEDAPPLKP